MKFLHLFNNSSTTTAAGFAKIQGYEDIKDIVRRALDSDEHYNLLFVGTHASSKTLFLQGILEIRKDGVYFDGSNTTNRIMDVLAWMGRCPLMGFQYLMTQSKQMIC